MHGLLQICHDVLECLDALIIANHANYRASD